MNMRLGFLLACGLMVGLLTSTARADMLYTFSGVNNTPGADGLSVGFTYTAAEPLTGTPPPYNGTALYASQLDSCLNCLVSSIVPAVVFMPNNVFGDSIDFADINKVETAFFFPSGAFSTPGTYTSSSPFNSGTLTVTRVPEPSSLSMVLGTGFMLGLALFRRKRIAAS